MNFIFCFNKRKKAKGYVKGNTLDLMILTVTICRIVAERIAEENGMELEQAIKFINESIKEGYGSLK